MRRKVRVRLIQGNDEGNPLMDEDISVGKRPISILQLGYTITEDGVMRKFSMHSRICRWSPLFASRKERLERQDIVQGEGEAAVLLKEYDLTNMERVRRSERSTE